MGTMNDVLTLILGGGRGTRLFPLTHMRSKPAVPIGGKYRLIDIPISNCLHAGLKRIFVLTQFNSASLNRHIAQTYRLDVFSDGFVEVLAAEQTPESSDWFQGTADAVRQAARHFTGYDADYYLILAGDHLYRMDFCELIEAHIESRADITIAAQPVTPRRRDRDGHLPLRRRGPDRRRSRRSRTTRGWPRSAAASRAARPRAARPPTSRSSPRWASTCSRATCCSRSSSSPASTSARRSFRRRSRRISVQRVHLPRLLGRRRHDRGVLRREHQADAARRAVQFLSSALADLHASAIPAGDARLRQHAAILDRRRRLLSRSVRDRGLGRRHPDARGTRNATHHALGAARRRFVRGGNQRQQRFRWASAATSCSTE